ncbi:MAG: hypothetical protein JO013_07840, partial [Alphaproteobacteria bacterium]|nr:hypothetical protein [Alphaproteobacteria bacterium]
SDRALDSECDYSDAGGTDGFWLDYVADTGDGWNPTYAVARLLAQAALAPTAAAAGQAAPSLPRGAVLVMGGDEVYPTPSLEEYDDRLRHPFDAAWEAESGVPAGGKRPDLFAVPGNHDWYDGLRSFFQLFCRRTIKADGQAGTDRRGAVICGRQTHQTRSYFALKLPGNWWLWAMDSQLAGYIDQPQVDYFQFVAQRWMEPGSRLILCTGTPDWEYVRKSNPGIFDTLSYVERLAPAVQSKGHQLKLLLSGDSHHYARFVENGLNHITCGGGGAFLHPTHHLPKDPIDFQTSYPEPGVPYDPAKSPYARRLTIARKQGTNEEALYPDRATSRRLTAGNLLFAFKNWELTLTLAGIYLFFTWLLDFNSRVSGHGYLADALAAGTLPEAVCTYWRMVAYSPWSVLLCGVAAVGYRYFADVAKGWVRTLVGAAHAAVQAAVVTLITCLATLGLAAHIAPGFWRDLVCLGVGAIASAGVSATVIGLYLWLCLSAFKIHWGHFSSLAVQDYKCFLRMHIDPEGKLHVYPIGLTKVPRTRGWPWQRNGKPATPPLEPHLIEAPLVIV